MKKMLVVDTGISLILAGPIVALYGSMHCMISGFFPVPDHFLNMLLFRSLAGVFLFGGLALVLVGARMRSQRLSKSSLDMIPKGGEVEPFARFASLR